MAFLAVLFLVAMIALAAAAATILWQIESRREQEKQLLFVGGEFSRALAAYRDQSGRVAQPYPTSLEQLLDDKRGFRAQRELRRLYVDPITASADWGLIRNPAGGIVAVYSNSSLRPIKISGFPEASKNFANARSYRDWIFLAQGAALPTQAVASSTANSAQSSPAPPAPPVAPVAPVSLDGGDASAPAASPPPPRNPRGVSPLTAQLGTVDGCNVILTADLGICAGQYTAYGDEAGSACTQSAMTRNSQCLAGGPLSQLYFRAH